MSVHVGAANPRAYMWAQPRGVCTCGRSSSPPLFKGRGWGGVDGCLVAHAVAAILFVTSGISPRDKRHFTLWWASLHPVMSVTSRARGNLEMCTVHSAQFSRTSYYLLQLTVDSFLMSQYPSWWPPAVGTEGNEVKLYTKPFVISWTMPYIINKV